jgi:NCS1 family nucleobase:cation symporter-1
MKTQPADVGVVRRLDRLYEYDREPVAQNQLHGCAHFAGIYAGEHVAATEFVIGALFVSWGARAGDVLIGLLLGNLMAVLSWTLVCAPIATQTRLTLYWYLRRIAGPGVTTIYNVLNAVLYCILAGSMITVSASAIRIPFGIPPQTHWYPDDMRFVLVVLGVGGVVVALAIWGFTRLAQFATLCAPWILAMFIAGALATWPDLAASVASAGGESAGFLDVARARIWTGVPVDGGEPITFWQIAAFAWICNIAMHLGLSDMAILRYARHASYGLNSAFGMFLGHYVAWIAAGIMGAAAALALEQPLTELDSGAVAMHALGLAGAIAVVIAGWTTSNPTLYRAGLALQAVTPNWPRWRVTLLAGGLTTLVACSPFVFTKLLSFVGIYGILLAPVGGIVTAYHFVLSKRGAAHQVSSMWSPPALIAWGAGSLGAVVLWQTGLVHLFFLAAPAWALSGVLYLVLARSGTGTVMPPEGSRVEGPEDGAPPQPMIETVADRPARAPFFVKAAGLAALLALVTCVTLPLRVLLSSEAERASRIGPFKTWLLVASLIYFVAAAVWVYRRHGDESAG